MEDRPYWNMEMEPLLATPEMREIQLKRLKPQLKMIYERSAIQRKYIDSLGVHLDKINSLEDLQKAFPPMDKHEMRQLVMSNMGEGGIEGLLNDFLCAPLNDVVLLATTSGTTGEPTPYFFTKGDLELMYESMARVLWRCGIRPGDVVVHAMGLSMFGGGIPCILSLVNFGAGTIPVGAESGTERVVTYLNIVNMVKGKIDGVFMTPSFAEYVIEKCPEILNVEVKNLGIKRLLSGGEPGAGIDSVKKKIEGAFGCRIYDMMGLTSGFWCSCDHDEYQGMHFVRDDTCIMELVDPETREPVPFEDGAIGEVVGTPLAGDSLNLIRFNSNDIMQVFTTPCPCGRSGTRYKVIGRSDDMLKVKGVMVYPASIDNVITGFVPRVTGEFRIVLTEPPPRVVPPLKLKVEHGEDVPEDKLPALAAEIADKMHDAIKIRPEITWIAPMSLERSAHKTQFIEKAYEG
jgi:phenylacetate-CoA ligase